MDMCISAFSGGRELKIKSLLKAELQGDVLQHCNPQFVGVLQPELRGKHSKYDTPDLPQTDWRGS